MIPTSVSQMSLSIPTPSSLSKNELVTMSLAGAVAFPAVLGLCQLTVFKPLCLTHGSSLASLCGCVSVLAAGCVASATAVRVLSLSNRWKNVTPPMETAPSVEFDVPELVQSAVTSAILFRAFGGRFSSVLPSHLLRPGAFARDWIPVRSSQATERQRHIIRELGKSHGCHSCGTRNVKQFYADHQPPTKLFDKFHDNGTTQRLYPQCRKCSNLQGTLLSRDAGSHNKWSAVRTHTLSLRGYHVFLPVPLLIAYLKSENNPRVNVSQNLSAIAVKENHEGKSSHTTATVQDPNKPSSQLQSFFSESNLPGLIRDFPLLIVWNRIVYFLDSFENAGDAFHITLLAFAVIAALGST